MTPKKAIPKRCKINYSVGPNFRRHGDGRTRYANTCMSATVAIVGAGRVGRAMGKRLRELGWRIGAVTTRSAPTARAAVRSIGAGQPADRLTHQLLAASVVLIATPDNAIESVAAELARLGGNEWRGKVVLHTSGALDSSALEPLAKAGAATGSIHPMQTFSSQRAPELAGRVFGIEGHPGAVKVARKMCHQIGGIAVRLSGAKKVAYHAAGSFACSHVLALLETGTRLLMAQGFTRRQANRALLPLTRQTIDNFEQIGPRAAWTGPLSRDDFSTLTRHGQALEEFPREYLDAYVALSRLTARVLAGDPKPALQRLDSLFGGPQKKRQN